MRPDDPERPVEPALPDRSRKSTDSSEPAGETLGRGRLVREVPDERTPTSGLDPGLGNHTNAEAARSPSPRRAGSEPLASSRDATGGPLRANAETSVPQSPDGAESAEERIDAQRLERLHAERDDPDRAEFRRAANGDERAFEILVERHQHRVFTRLFFLVRNRETAADLTQEAFLRAWRGLSSFREESLFTTWLAKVALNVTRHHWERERAQKRTRREFSIDAPYRDEDGGGYEIADSTHLPEEWALRNERQKRILAAVAELDPEFREALSLRELHGYSYQEISETLDLPIGTVKSKIFRARQALQEKLKDLL